MPGGARRFGLRWLRASLPPLVACRLRLSSARRLALPAAALLWLSLRSPAFRRPLLLPAFRRRRRWAPFGRRSLWRSGGRWSSVRLWRLAPALWSFLPCARYGLRFGRPPSPPCSPAALLVPSRQNCNAGCHALNLIKCALCDSIKAAFPHCQHPQYKQILFKSELDTI